MIRTRASTRGYTVAECSLPYIIVARMTRTLKASAAVIKDWTPVDAHYSAASFDLKLHGWSKERRFVVIREKERDEVDPVLRPGLHKVKL